MRPMLNMEKAISVITWILDAPLITDNYLSSEGPMGDAIAKAIRESSPCIFTPAGWALFVFQDPPVS